MPAHPLHYTRLANYTGYHATLNHTQPLPIRHWAHYNQRGTLYWTPNTTPPPSGHYHLTLLTGHSDQGHQNTLIQGHAYLEPTNHHYANYHMTDHPNTPQQIHHPTTLDTLLQP